MTEKTPAPKKGFSADWLMRGALTKIGDTVDRFTGRKWTPSSSLATSELIERIKKLLDTEAKDVSGKGTVVPHNIKLKVQWDKFSTDSEEALTRLENELLVATADHINDSLYYTYAPLSIEVKPDYFVDGVKLLVSFDKFVDDEASDVEMNVTMAGVNVAGAIPQAKEEPRHTSSFIARFSVNGVQHERKLELAAGGSISVGRTGSNALIIDEPSLSKIHASLTVDNDGVLSVADTGSTNGTFINGQRISYGKATRLVAGDRLKFGTVEVKFEPVESPSIIEESDENISGAKTIAIDGFEFTSRTSSEETPVEEKAADPVEEPDK
ncbi:MAG TPA: FHA domain-containing protein [Pyrinomonadaceae bacterium]|nr:FHA domain-containing protein [Pyrinomonadaceae bacterium]